MKTPQLGWEDWGGKRSRAQRARLRQFVALLKQPPEVDMWVEAWTANEADDQKRTISMYRLRDLNGGGGNG